MATASGDLTEAERAFLAYDWAKSEKWQSYLMNLYPVPPQNRILKWKIKFFKAQVNPNLDIDSPALAAALGEQDSSASWRARAAPEPRCAQSSSSASAQPRTTWSQDARSSSTSRTRGSLLRRKLLPPLCVLGLLCGLLLSYFAAAAEKVASRKLTYSAAGTHLLFFSFLAHLYIVLGKPPFRLADLSGAMSGAFANYMQQAIVQDSSHAMLYLLFTSTMPPSFPALFSPTISALLVICSLIAGGDGIPAFVCRLPLLGECVQKVQAKRYRLLQTRADVEVFFGILFIGSRLLTLNLSLSGSIVPAFLYINLLKMRYSTCGFTHTTFQRINGVLRRIVYHPACPGIVAVLYEKVNDACARR